MKLSDFILLGEEEKKKSLVHDGVLVAKRKSSGLMVFLFQFPEYYVEALFHPDTRGVAEFRAFTGPRALEAYLGSIPIEGLVP